MSRLRGLLDRQHETSDVESEREALRRQRLEAAAEIEALKAALGDRVAHVQERERELEQALARVQKREQALEAAADRGSRLKGMGTWLAEAQAARAARGDEKERGTIETLRAELTAVRATLAVREQDAAASTEQPTAQAAALEGTGQAPEPELTAVAARSGAASKKLKTREKELEARAAELDAREATLAEREAERSDRETAPAAAAVDDAPNQELTERQTSLEIAEGALAAKEAEQERRAEELTALESAVVERERIVAAREQARVNEPDGDGTARAEARLEELRSAERAFVKTRAELAARSDALAEREQQLAARERAVVVQETPTPDLDALEARIRRLEQGGRKRGESTQTFSAGLRALQDRGLRAPVDERNEPLH